MNKLRSPMRVDAKLTLFNPNIKYDLKIIQKAIFSTRNMRKHEEVKTGRGVKIVIVMGRDLNLFAAEFRVFIPFKVLMEGFIRTRKVQP